MIEIAGSAAQTCTRRPCVSLPRHACHPGIQVRLSFECGIWEDVDTIDAEMLVTYVEMDKLGTILSINRQAVSLASG